MKIEFKLSEYDDIIEKFYDLFNEYDERDETEEQDGNVLIVSSFRIVIPELQASFREGEWYWRDPDKGDEEPQNPEEDSSDADEESDSEEDEFQLQESVYIRYDENEKDINQYLSYMTKGIYYSVYSVLCEKKMPTDNIDDIQCYIDTSEFLDEEVVQEYLEEYEEEQ